MNAFGHPHRRSTDTLKDVAALFATFLPPSLCIFFAAVIAHSVEMSPNHDLTAPAATAIIAVLTASFGRAMFREWISHKEKRNEAPTG